MLHKEIAGLSILFFILWIFVASSGSARVQRTCAPVDWTGNVILSAAALMSPDSQVPLTKTMDKVVYGCEYVFWRLFYQDSYLEWAATRAQQLGVAGVAPVVPTDSPEPESGEDDGEDGVENEPSSETTPPKEDPNAIPITTPTLRVIE